ncbi:MAG: chromosome segregation protein SMC [Aestuariivita sp.]|nr:chromosome segregation protein SMC [Aestuariivita sp.]MCY4345800.1 chromosome segregation protein SMC [Aestuariivita sp.]
MRFSRLRLIGFKSFVDPADLTIADGLTGVVGPNGCGKSNLLEAIRWVMGENRPSSMRGEGMDDVIFAGSVTRPARNFAEVTLSIETDNPVTSFEFDIEDDDTLEVTRRITRDVGSAYKTNGKDVRARDIQMLFADASTGAHSPSLVRQGQIAEIINAKPKARRHILEEAAGISGLYQRRHEAELKLRGAETNLERVADVIAQLQAQLQQLERQAKQAARYRKISESLRSAEGRLLYRRWREAEDALNICEQELVQVTLNAGRAEVEAQQKAKHRNSLEAALPPLREAEAVAAAKVQRLLVQRDGIKDAKERSTRAIEALSARRDQLSHDIQREHDLERDAKKTTQRLEEESQALLRAEEGHEKRLSIAAKEAHEAAIALQHKETELSQVTEDTARLAARHQSAQRLIQDHRVISEQSAKEEERANEAVVTAATMEKAAEAEHKDALSANDAARKASAAAEAACAETDQACTELYAREAEARAQRSQAEGECGAIQAEVVALEKLLQREASEEEQVIDLIEVAHGFEKAVGAALADEIRSPVVDADGPSGWSELPELTEVQELPSGVTPLANHVTVPPALSRRMSQTGVIDSDLGSTVQAQLQRGQRIVSVEGDLWRWDGYRAWAEDTSNESSLRLEQINRLEVSRQELETISEQVEATRLAHDNLNQRLQELVAEDDNARKIRRETDQLSIEAARRLSQAEANHNLARARHEAATLAAKRHHDATVAVKTQLEEAERAAAELDDLVAARSKAEEFQREVESARLNMIRKRSNHDELQREGKTRRKRQQDVIAEIGDWKKRRDTAEQRAHELSQRLIKTEADLASAKATPDELVEQQQKLSVLIQQAEAEKAEATDQLSSAESERQTAMQEERVAERRASEVRESRAAIQARRQAAAEMVAAATDRISENLQMTPNQLRDRFTDEDVALKAANELEIEINSLKRQRDALGAVNLRAEEDALAVQEEFDSLSGEKSDLEEAIKKLRAGISSLNQEGQERLLTAFEQVSTNFSDLFKHLFGGGEARLEMVESDDPLAAGLEVYCQPPGKKLTTLSLLSGGEQTLTALAMIFAVFLANPSPICVLDEVDAPLDDANIARFCDLLDQMCGQTKTRFMIITHHAITMSRMHRLFGVTMAEQGVSQIVSVDLERAERLIA